MSEAVNVLALVRDEHRFVFLYDDTSVDTLLATLSDYASDPDMAFNWHDAAVLAQRVRGMLEQQQYDEELKHYPRAS
ncbi:MAG: hypothetical protein RIK87_00105 [Fuerstiella sp.]